MAWDLSYITKQVEEQAVEHVRDIATDISAVIGRKSPVRTSRLVSNNNISTIMPDDYFDEERKLGRAGAIQAMAEEASQIQTLTDVWITNETPYGPEQEAKHGFYRIALPAVARKYGY